MDPTTATITVSLSFLPISELRGAIPFAVARGVPLLEAAAVAIACTALVAPVAIAFLETAHKLLYRWPFYAGVFDRFVAKAQRRVYPKVSKYGYWGILLFVAIPLPITGAWTGTLGSWILGLDKRKTMMAVFGGVIVSGLIVTSLVVLGVGIDSVFIKRI